MKLYTHTELQSPKTKQILVPSTAKSIILDNYSPYQFELNSTHGTISLLPFSTRSIPVVSGSTWECSPSGSIPSESLGDVSFDVTLFYSSYSFNNYGQSSSLPLFNAPITITNATVNVGGTVNANISNATINVKGNVNANISNATINIKPSASAVFNITGSVNINSNQTVLVKNATGSDLTIAGTVDANIKNATIDTNSTVVNEQIITGQGHAVNSTQFSIPSGSTSQTSDTVVVLSAGTVVLSSDIDVAMVSANGYEYDVNIVPQVKYPSGEVLNTVETSPNLGWAFNGMVSAQTISGSSAFTSSLALGYGFAQLNQIKVYVKPTTANTSTDDVTIYIIVNGQSVEIADQDVNIGVYTPNGIALAQAYTNTSTNSPVAVSTSNPLPTKISNGHKVFISVSTVKGQATNNFTSITMSHIYSCFLSAGGDAGGVLRIEMSGGAWVNQVLTPNNNQQSVSNWEVTGSEGISVSGYPQVVQRHGNTTSTVYYSVTMEYD